MALAVAPLVGAWIEIVIAVLTSGGTWSLPSWERGLKSSPATVSIALLIVAPLVGAWIEITISCAMYTIPSVAPLVGAWIEIPVSYAVITF